MRVGLARPHIIGAGPLGVRVVGGVTTGTVRGTRLNGTIVGPGADWMLIGPDGFGRVDVRLQIETDDGAVIYVRYEGLIELNAASSAALMDPAAETAWDDQYFRTAPRFETGDERYAWLNQTAFVGARPGHHRWPRVRGVPGRMTVSDVLAAARPAGLAASLVGARRCRPHRACGGAGADGRVAGGGDRLRELCHGDAGGERHLPRAQAVRATAPAAAPARPRRDLRRHRRHLHGGDRARPRRGHPRRPAGAGVGHRRRRDRDPHALVRRAVAGDRRGVRRRWLDGPARLRRLRAGAHRRGAGLARRRRRAVHTRRGGVRAAAARIRGRRSSATTRCSTRR